MDFIKPRYEHMDSIELVKSIYEKAAENGKQAWLSDKQNRFIFSLLYKEGRLNEKATKHFIAHILPGGEWIKDLTIGEAIKIGEENIKKVYIISPPFYIKREGFIAQKIVVI
jgi:hypothetical protein